MLESRSCMDKLRGVPEMSINRQLLNLTAADFIVRTAYQMGKTPLLPLFAAGLGANATFLGFIVSASTLTGMLLKPLFGFLSDRWGRWVWFFIRSEEHTSELQSRLVFYWDTAVFHSSIFLFMDRKCTSIVNAASSSWNCNGNIWSSHCCLGDRAGAGTR